MNKPRKERTLHDAFEVSILLKGIDGIAELIGGILLLIVPPDTIQNIFLFFARDELAEDPKDFVANHLLHFVERFSTQSTFYSWLFIIHGAVKIFLVAALSKNKLWAYPAAIAAFSLFVLYQLYQMTFDYSTLLLIITVIDLAVIALTAHEYIEVKRKSAALLY
jgi:uncharacterized membrane protein